MKKIIVAVLATACSLAAQAGALQSLEQFIQSARTGRADFTQVVTSPAKAGQGARTRTSSGTFEFQRPDRFRFEYRKPFEQTLVADGQRLWMHDKDLNQVTSRKQARVLSSTPAALIASSSDIASLRRDFDLQELPDAGGLQWVQARPKSTEGQVALVKIGFRGSELAALDITDGFGQRSQITFSGLQLNAGVSPDAFRFTPPQGVDVVEAP